MPRGRSGRISASCQTRGGGDFGCARRTGAAALAIGLVDRVADGPWAHGILALKRGAASTCCNRDRDRALGILPAAICAQGLNRKANALPGAAVALR